jgi:hypothetical protein
MGPYDLLHTVVEVFERLQISYLVTGSVASMAYGEPRLTNDIDIVADVHPDHVGDLLAAFPAPEYYIDAEMIREAIRRTGQFNIIHPASGFKVDIIIREETPFNRSRFSRKRRLRPSKEYEADFASPEDVILKKMEYYKEGGSEKHLRDITGILRVSGEKIDRQYITFWAERLRVQEVWEAVLRRLN